MAASLAGPHHRCASAIADKRVAERVYTAPGWKIACVRVIRGQGLPRRTVGLTIPARRTILIKNSQSHPVWTVAHELAHAYSLDELSAAARTAFAHEVGRKKFFAPGPWAGSPAEIWANNQARCAGYRNTAPTRVVSCRVIRSYLRG